MAINLDDIVSSVIAGGDSSSTVAVTEGSSAKTKSGSHLMVTE